ncbi:type II toxin-antitoxin system RelE/ParE family toxin [Gulosibacter molinativorax]|uniref:Type II toxin-antitoxin system RelE/ParE family toxin n=1 Tax=Gulosibacter molinativorax TaxID=256821 RepID=A0ABT7CAP9_9MICO|nr:type II toxin-antitoxin system RelE/ParE family toxin [Gulosibacter molinativorax]MDJ1372278.1 type II toxin-antitoxin system RelE/ParE family toxin [Gulosibacter molinativorax]QUY63437.1 Hypotetical protein [Gulosibacter molinativorax]
MNFVRSSHPEATADLIDAAKWYEAEQTGLGVEFLQEAEEAVQSILEWPQIAPVLAEWDEEPVVRAKSLSVFPYRVLYYLTENELRVVAYAHDRREPNFWAGRL